jgi:hypothetical protein
VLVVLTRCLCRALLSFRASILYELSELLESSPIHVPLDASAPNEAGPALESQGKEEDPALAFVPPTIWAQPVEKSGSLLLEHAGSPLRLFEQHAPGALDTEKTAELLILQNQNLDSGQGAAVGERGSDLSHSPVNVSTEQDRENLVDTAAQHTNTSVCEHDLSLDEEVPFLLGFRCMCSDDLGITAYV